MKVKTELKAGKGPDDKRCWNEPSCGRCKKCVKNANEEYGTNHDPTTWCAGNGIC